MDDHQLLVSTFAGMQAQAIDADKKRLGEIEGQWKKFGEIQDRKLLIRIGYSSQEFFEDLLKVHPGTPIFDNVSNVHNAFNILERSRSSFVDLLGAFHSRVVYRLNDKEDRNTTLSQATKEFFTYSCAAISLVQAYRHLISGNEIFKENYEAFKKETFQNSHIPKLFSDLRNSNNHDQILTARPHYSIKRHLESGKEEVISGLRINRDIILSSKEWSQTSKALVKARTDLQAIELIEEHFKLASKFYNAVLFRAGIHQDKKYRDLLRVKAARKAIGTKVSLSLALQFVKKKNPYEYLHKWFTHDELENIYSFKDNSKEQLEYIIALRDPMKFCDRDLRENLYELFSVDFKLLPKQVDDKIGMV